MKLIRNKEQVPQKRPDGRNIKRRVIDSFNNLKVSFLLIEHPMNFKEKSHLHNESFEVFFFLDYAKYKINSRIYDIRGGDLILLEPGNIHGGAMKVGNGARLFVMQIPPVRVDKIYGVV